MSIAALTPNHSWGASDFDSPGIIAVVPGPSTIALLALAAPLLPRRKARH